MKGILFILLIATNSIILSQDYSGWSEARGGTGYYYSVFTRTDEFSTAKSYHSPNSIILGSNSGNSGSITISKVFSIEDLSGQLSSPPTKLYLSMWEKDGLIDTHYYKQVLVNDNIIYTQSAATTSWQHIQLDISSYLNNATVTVKIKLYSNYNRISLIETYWDNICLYFENSINREYRKQIITGVKATYAGLEDYEQKFFNGTPANDTIRVNQLMDELENNEANTYSDLIWYDSSTTTNFIRWNILKDQILPKLNIHNKDCWVTLVPPTESWLSSSSMPYGEDYIAWAMELAGLSIENTNLKAFNIDDFNVNPNLVTFNATYLTNMIGNGSHTINPLFSFVVTAYYEYDPGFIVCENGRTPIIADQTYLTYIDGILFPFIWKTFSGWGSLFNTTKYFDQMEEYKGSLATYSPDNEGCPVISLIYVNNFDSTISTPEYVYELGQRVLEKADGIYIYPQYLEWQDDDDTYNCFAKKKKVVENLFKYCADNVNSEQRILLMNNGHEIFYLNAPQFQNYLFCPDWYNETQEIDFDNIYNVTSGDYDGDGLTDIAVFYDYPGTTWDTPQRIFVFPDRNQANNPMANYQFKLRNGTEADNSWFSSTLYNHNFEFHQSELSGDFNGDGVDEIAILYDYAGDDNSNPNTPQRIFVYKKNASLDKFEIAWGTEGSGSWFNSIIYNHNFDCHRKDVVGDFNGDGRDELMFLYDYEGSDPSTPQRVFMYRQDNIAQNKFNIWWGGGSGGSWLDTTKVFDFELIKDVLVADYDQDGNDEVAVLFDSSYNKQEIFVFKLDIATNKLVKVQGTETEGSWFCSSRYNHNFNLHKVRVAGKFDKDTIPDLMFYYDSDNRQSVFTYHKNSSANYFEPYPGATDNPGGLDWFYHKIYDYSNFDYYKFAVAGNFYDESLLPYSPNRDDIVVFYKNSDYNPGKNKSDNQAALKDSTLTYNIYQNFPNPFNPTTTIKYAIPKDGFVTLEIYNILGERVAQLVNKQQKAGGYEVKFNAAALSSGVYFYKITSGSYINTKKMMLIK